MADKTAPPEVFGLVHALRGVAATWVVLFHASEGRHIDQVRASLPEWLHPLFDLGDNGVAIFFALSGFVIAHSLRSDRITPSYLGRFALRRSIRLDPPLWASIVLVVALAALSAEVKDGAWAAPSLGQVITNATYTQLFVGYASLNVVYWTLCYEVQFYLVLVVSIAAAQRFGATVYIAMFLLAVLFGTGVAHTPISGLFIDLWHCFFLGVISYWAHRSRAAVLGFALLCALLLVSGPSTFTLTCMATAVGLYLARRFDYIRSGLTWRPLMFLGTISYSLYLTHNPITGASFFLLAKLGTPQWFALGATILICIAFAYAFWLAFEQPSMKLAHRVRLRSPAGEKDTTALAPSTVA